MTLLQKLIKTKRSALTISLLVLSTAWVFFWIVFLVTHEQSNILARILGTSVAVCIESVVPSLMMLSVVPTITAQKERPPVYLYLSISVLGGYGYIILTGYILHYAALLNPLALAVVWGLIPVLVSLVRREYLRQQLSAIYHLVDTTDLRIIVLVFVVSLLLRYPLFTAGETGSDSFVIHTLINSMIVKGQFDWVLSPFSLIQMGPPMMTASPLLFVGGTSMIGGISVHYSILVFSIQSGIIFGILAWMLVRYCEMSGILSASERNFALIFLILMPLLLKFSDWTVSGRTVFLMMAPGSMISLFVLLSPSRLFRSEKIKIGFLFVIVCITSHGIGRIFLVFGLALAAINRFINACQEIHANTYLTDNFNQKEGIMDILSCSAKALFIRIYLQWRKSKISAGRMVPILGVFGFLMPYILHTLGYTGLVNLWILNRSQTFIVGGRNCLGLLFSFLFVFTARLGIVSPLVIAAFVLFPRISSGKDYLLVTALATLVFFPLMPNSMYFYQSLAVPFTILAAVMCQYLLSGFKFHIRRMRYADVPRFLTSEKTFALCIASFCLVSTMYIQYYRYEFEDASISPELVEIASKIEQNGSEKSRTCFVSNGNTARQLFAFSPETPVFPMSKAVYIEYFNPSPDEYIFYTSHLSWRLKGLINLFRYGPFRLRFPTLSELNSASYSTSLQQFIAIQQRYNVRFLVHYVSDDWPLLQMLKTNNMTVPVVQREQYTLYHVVI